MEKVVKIKLPVSLYNYMQSYILEKDETVDNIMEAALRGFFEFDKYWSAQREFFDKP